MYSLFEYLDGDDDRDAILLACQSQYSTTEEMSDNVQDVKDSLYYVGKYHSDIVRYFMDDAYDTGIAHEDNPLLNYVDWEHYARNMMHHYTKIETKDGIYLWETWC